MDAALVGAVFAGITGLITAAGGLAANRRTRSLADTAALETSVDQLRATNVTAMAHIHHLRMLLAAHGVQPPDLPDGITPRRGGEETP